MWTPVFEWYMVSCGSKGMYLKDAHLEEIRCCTKYILTI